MSNKIEAIILEEQIISLSDCKIGMILAKDIIYNGLKLVAKNTALNSYIIDKLIRLGIYEVCVCVLKDEKCLDKSNNIVENFKRDYESNVGLIKKIIDGLTIKNKVNPTDVLKISKSLINYLDETRVISECLMLVKDADEYTYTHSLNVGIYSMFIAKWMNLSLDSIIEILNAGLIHDIGKTQISNKILNKPSKLSYEEFSEIKKHTLYGYHLANQYEDFNENIKDAVLMHHERIDGSGYPYGISEKDITIGAKIVSVADTFDAMTSKRVYKNGATPFEAFKMFLTEGIKMYDFSVISTLIENISAYYIGMKVTLEDGRVGEIVYIPPNDALSPIVKIDDELIDFYREENLKIENIFI